MSVMTAAGSESAIEGEGHRRRVDPMALAAVVLALCGLVQLRTCAKLIRADHADLVGEEYNVVYATERLMETGVLYSDPARPPYAVTQYSPLDYLVAAASARLAGLRADDALGITRLLRAISFACLLGQGAIVAVILRRHAGTSRRIAFVASVAVLVFQTPWCLAARPDSMEALLVMAATLLGLEALRAADNGGRPVVWLAASLTCGTLAILAKQSGFIAGLIVLPPALAVHGVRRTLLACLLAALPSLGLAAATLLPLGPAVKANLIGGVDNGLDPRAALQVAYVPYLRSMAIPAAGGLLAALGLLTARRPGPSGRADAAIGWGALISIAVAAPLALKYGSSVNYFNIFNNFLILAIGARLVRSPGWTPLVALSLALALPAEAYHDLNATIREPRPYGECAEVARRLRELLGDGPDGPLFFSQDPRLDALLPDRAAAPGKLVVAILDRRRVVDYSDFARAVRDGTVRYCVTLDDRPTDLKSSFDAFSKAQTLAPDPTRPAFLGASFEGFRPLFRVGPHTVYESPHPALR